MQIGAERRPIHARVASPEERARLWQGRKKAFGALGRLNPDLLVQDAVVPRTALPQVLERIGAIAAEYGVTVSNVFHAGDGNLHPNIMFDPQEPGATERVLELGGEIMKVCVDAGGSITGEHGIGYEKRSYMEGVFGPADLDAMDRVRVAVGGADRFNPCKVLPTGHGCATGHAADMQRAIATPGVYV